MARAVAKREDLPVEYTWDLASIFPSESDWDAEVEKTAQMLQKLDGYRGRLAESGTILLEALETIEQIWTRLGHVFAYASMLRDQDTTNQAAAAKDDRAMGLYPQVSAATAFVEPEILAIGASTLQNWMNETSGLEIYGHYFDHLEQQRAHIDRPRSSRFWAWRSIPSALLARSTEHSPTPTSPSLLPSARVETGSTFLRETSMP